MTDHHLGPRTERREGDIFTIHDLRLQQQERSTGPRAPPPEPLPLLPPLAVAAVVRSIGRARCPLAPWGWPYV